MRKKVICILSFVLRVEGLEYSINLTPGIGGKPYKTLFLGGLATGSSIAQDDGKIKDCPKNVRLWKSIGYCPQAMSVS